MSFLNGFGQKFLFGPYQILVQLSLVRNVPTGLFLSNSEEGAEAGVGGDGRKGIAPGRQRIAECLLPEIQGFLPREYPAVAEKDLEAGSLRE